MKRFFTADLHLGHRRIIDHCYRPFASVEEMDFVLIDRINQRVGKSDVLYIVGDFCLGKLDEVKSYRQRINCHAVNLIRGNHDRLSADKYREAGFHFTEGLLDLNIEGQPITLCHYAMRRWNKSHKGSWCLFGHSHGSLPDDPTLFSFDVGVDCWNYYPLEFVQINSLMAGRRASSCHCRPQSYRFRG